METVVGHIIKCWYSSISGAVCHLQKRFELNISVWSASVLWVFEPVKMSVVFVPKRQRGKAQINQETIQRVSKHLNSVLNSCTHTHSSVIYGRNDRFSFYKRAAIYVFRTHWNDGPVLTTNVSYVIYVGLVCVVVCFLVTYGDADIREIQYKDCWSSQSLSFIGAALVGCPLCAFTQV